MTCGYHNRSFAVTETAFGRISRAFDILLSSQAALWAHLGVFLAFGLSVDLLAARILTHFGDHVGAQIQNNHKRIEHKQGSERSVDKVCFQSSPKAITDCFSIRNTIVL